MPSTTNSHLQFLSGNGEMATLTREKDWTNTPVGLPDTWPQSLRTTLGIILKSRFPMFLWWGPELTCFYNDAYRPSLGKEGKHPSILGIPARDAWPEIWEVISPLIDQVLSGGEATWSENQLIPIYRNGHLEDVYWTFSYSPVHDESGKVAGVLVTCNETTENVNNLKSLEEMNRRYYNHIMQAPVAMAILSGKDHRVEIANELMLQIWGKRAGDVMNKPIFEGLPEAIGQGFEDILANVYHTGEKFVANERSVFLPRNGKLEETFLNFVYEALREPDGSISGLVVIASEVTPQVMARKKVEEVEKRFRNTVKQLPLGITILRGSEFIPEMANETYLQLVDKLESDFVGKPLFDSLPEVKEVVEPLLNEVLETGVAFRSEDLSVVLNRYGKKEKGFFNLVYHPLMENGEITGIIVVAMEVTASVKAREALFESEKQFRNLVMQSPIPMTIFRGKEHVIELANKVMFEKIWRRNPQDTVGKKLLDVFPELKEQKYVELLDHVFNTGEIHREDEAVALVQGDDGLKKFYLDFEYNPFYATDGTIDGIIVTVNDVSEKVEARKKVEEAEERLRLATEATELSTWDLDLHTREIIHSPRLAEIFGHDRSTKLSHKEMRAQVHPDDHRDIIEQAFKDAMITSIYEYEVRLIKPDSSTCWIRTQGKVFYDEKGQPFKMIGTLRDITEEKLSRQVLQESEQKFRLLADSMPQHIWTSDPAGNLNYFNQSVYRFSGLSPEQLEKDGWLQIVHPEDREENIRQWEKAVKAGHDFLLEHRFRRNDGEYRWQLSRAIPQTDSEGNIQMWVGTSTDIQDQKIFTNELERQVLERTRELEEKNNALEKMNDELQSFAYISSHDLQEPLRKIQTFASHIVDKERQNLSQKGTDYLKRMQKSANRMQTLIQDLLTYSRTNATERVFADVELSDLMNEIKDEFSESLSEKRAVIETGELTTVHVIPFQFKQLLHNLLSNSLKFSKQDTIPHIFVKSEIISGEQIGYDAVIGKKYCHIVFSDNGIGFDPLYKDRIFEVFQRLHAKEEFTGTGIGLSIVKKIVENHHGIITATGELGKGTTIDVYIPAS